MKMLHYPEKVGKTYLIYTLNDNDLELITVKPKLNLKGKLLPGPKQCGVDHPGEASYKVIGQNFWDRRLKRFSFSYLVVFIWKHSFAGAPTIKNIKTDFF